MKAFWKAGVLSVVQAVTSCRKGETKRPRQLLDSRDEGKRRNPTLMLTDEYDILPCSACSTAGVSQLTNTVSPTFANPTAVLPNPIVLLSSPKPSCHTPSSVKVWQTSEPSPRPTKSWGLAPGKAAKRRERARVGVGERLLYEERSRALMIERELSQQAIAANGEENGRVDGVMVSVAISEGAVVDLNRP
jgi:hypothetical protein